MAYTKTVWVNDGAPAISASNLNKIENELELLDTTAIQTQSVLHDADLNTIEESGIYAIVSNYTYTNCPVTAGATLTVTKVASSAIYQNIFSRAQGSWMRAKMSSTGVWSEWTSIVPIESSITSGGTNPVNSTAVIAYINSLDATNTSY